MQPKLPTDIGQFGLAVRPRGAQPLLVLLFCYGTADKHFGNVRLMCPFNLERHPLQRVAQLETLKVAMMSSCLVRAPQSFLSLSPRLVTSVSLPPLWNPMTSISSYSQYSPRQHNSPQPQNVSKFSFTMTKRTLFTSPPLLCAPSSGEQVIISALAKSFPNATDIAVVDISGGCGSMYEVFIEAPDFRGVRLVKQHQLVTKALKAEIGEMHGIRIATQATPGCGGGQK